jgi:hypothetical protein
MILAHGRQKILPPQKGFWGIIKSRSKCCRIFKFRASVNKYLLDSQFNLTDIEPFHAKNSPKVIKIFHPNNFSEPILDPQLVKATIENYPVIQNMARFYVYDMSRYCSHIPTWECPESGLYECIDLKIYFEFRLTDGW